MRRFALLLLIAAVVAAAILSGHAVGWETLGQYQVSLLRWVALHPVGAALLFLLSYIVTVALLLPHAALLTTAGGLLFGPLAGLMLTLTGATLGATILLVAVRAVFGTRLSRYQERIPEFVRARLERDGFSYLLAVRLVPLVPFVVINLASAVAGIRLAVFIPATIIGMAPTSLILSYVGAGIGGVLAAGRTPDLTILFTPPIFLPLAGLAALSLLPIVFRRRNRTHA